MSTKTKTSKSEEARVGTGTKVTLYVVLAFLTVVFLGPIFFIIVNSFKNKLSIANNPFALPTGELWAGVENYAVGLMKEGFLWAILWSFVITILSVAAIVFFSAMTAYYITRVKTWWTSALYYLFVFSMVIPLSLIHI